MNPRAWILRHVCHGRKFCSAGACGTGTILEREKIKKEEKKKIR